MGAAADDPLVTSADLQALERLTLDSLDALLHGLGGRQGGPGRSGGFEFVDYRRYTPGDDVRQIDWSVYARLRELHVRTAPQESRLALALLVDGSASMDFGEPSKLRHAQRLAALLGVVALLRADSVQLHTLHDGDAISGGLHDTTGAFAPLLHELQNLPTGRTTDLASSVRRARDQGADAKMAVLISDALTSHARLQEALVELRHDASAAALMHIIGADDAEAGPGGPFVLIDRETSQRIELDVTEEARVMYAELYAQMRADIERACHENGVRYVPVPTSVDPLTLLLDRARSESLLLPHSG